MADGAVDEVYCAVFERLVTGSGFEGVYTSILSRLPAADRQLLDEALAARSKSIFDTAGRHVGLVNGVFVDRETGAPQWLAVAHDQYGRERLVGMPTSALGTNEMGMTCTAAPVERIWSAPLLDVEFVSALNELELCRHYGLPLTRGAAEGRSERRATSSRAFQDRERGEPIRWLPGPRELSGLRD